ncbi:MAG: hypothetical protein WCK67_05055 [bacterium]
MGLVAGQARVLLLTDQKSTLEFQMQRICQKEMNLSAQAQNFMNDDNIQKQVFELNKQLELQQKQIEAQHKMIETELESAKKVVDKNIESSFKYFA